MNNVFLGHCVDVQGGSKGMQGHMEGEVLLGAHLLPVVTLLQKGHPR